jgi:predicted molibdopterin-dependent oxidoreductase YjgC
VSWEAALAAASQRLGATAPERLGVFTTTRLTNEALGLLHAIFVKHLKAAHRGASHGAVPGMPAGRCGKLADIADSDLILLAGSDPARDQPVASFLIKRALDRGARLVTVENHPTELTAFAEAIFAPRQISPAVAMAEAAEKPAVIYGAGLTPEEATALGMLDAKAVFIPLHPGVNTLTAETLALNGEMDPAACDTLFIAAGDENGTLEAITQKAGPKAFVIVQACYGSTLADRADLLLPMATWLERSGTFTNTEGILQRAHAALTPSGQSRPDWDILGRLAERLGLDAAIAKDAVLACRV